MGISIPSLHCKNNFFFFLGLETDPAATLDKGFAAAVAAGNPLSENTFWTKSGVSVTSDAVGPHDLIFVTFLRHLAGIDWLKLRPGERSHGRRELMVHVDQCRWVTDTPKCLSGETLQKTLCSIFDRLFTHLLQREQ